MRGNNNRLYWIFVKLISENLNPNFSLSCNDCQTFLLFYNQNPNRHQTAREEPGLSPDHLTYRWPSRPAACRPITRPTRALRRQKPQTTIQPSRDAPDLHEQPPNRQRPPSPNPRTNLIFPTTTQTPFDLHVDPLPQTCRANPFPYHRATSLTSSVRESRFLPAPMRVPLTTTLLSSCHSRTFLPNLVRPNLRLIF